jgi:flagellar biosynthesis/type III secretory pathway M-ring protein FliF/YscJ
MTEPIRTLKGLKDVVDALYDMSGKKSDQVMIKFKTFDPKFDEHADEYQRPEAITSVEFDILNWDAVTLTIETPKKSKGA